MKFDESAVLDNYEHIKPQQDLFPPVGITKINLSNYKTSVNKEAGIELWDIIKNKQYFSYLSASIVKGLMIGFVMILAL